MLIILAGVTIHAIVGDNGIINKTRKAAEDTERAKVQEELEMIITELEMGALMQKKELTVNDIKDALSKLKDITIENPIGNVVEGEYKNFGFIVNDKTVTVNEMISGEKPVGSVINITELEKGKNAIEETVDLQVKGTIENGSIARIEAIETDYVVPNPSHSLNSQDSKVFTVSENGTYHFRITGNTGRSYIAIYEVTNAVPSKKDLITGIAALKSGGYKRVKVNGQTKTLDGKTANEEAMYDLKVAYCPGDLILKNGSFTTVRNQDTGEITEEPIVIDYLNLTDKVWSVGEASDIGTRIVVLKVDGNLTIEKDFTLTSVKKSENMTLTYDFSYGSYSGNQNVNKTTKGLFICCSGDLIVNGTIEMNQVLCDAERSKCIFMEK